jgi:hypothetical protein
MTGVICPKCKYERVPEDIAPDWQCPQCGIAYAKFRAEGAPAATPPQSAPSAPFTVSTPQVAAASRSPQEFRWLLPYAGCVLAGIIIGYFAGRFHVQWQIAQAFAGAATAFAEGMSSLTAEKDSPAKRPAPPKAASTPAPTAPPPPPPIIEIDLVNKSYRPADTSARIYSDAITFTLSIANVGDRDVRAFDGTLRFLDLLDNNVLSLRLTINDPIAAGETLNWQGQLDYNQFKDEHQRLRSEGQENLQVVFEPRKVLFADGSSEEF